MKSFEDVYCCHKQLPNLKLSKNDLDEYGPIVEKVAKKAFRQFFHIWRPAAFDYGDLYNVGLIHLTIFCNKYIDRTLPADQNKGIAGSHVKQKLRTLAKKLNTKLSLNRLKAISNLSGDDLNHLENIPNDLHEEVDGEYVLDTGTVQIPIEINICSKGLTARHKDTILPEKKVQNILKSVHDGKATIERKAEPVTAKPLKELRKRWAAIPKKQKATLLQEMVDLDGYAAEEAKKALGYIDAGTRRLQVKDTPEYVAAHKKVKEDCLSKLPPTHKCKKCGMEDAVANFGLRVSHDKETGLPKTAWIQCYCPKCRNP